MSEGNPYKELNYSNIPEETDGKGGNTPNPKEKSIPPMSPAAASATIINLFLATGPFGYPFGFVHLGPVMALSLLVITACVSYMTCCYVIEVVSTANAIKNSEDPSYTP
jgi:hypothetical protein